MLTIKVVSTLKSMKLIRNGCQGYIAQIVDTTKEGVKWKIFQLYKIF